MKNLIIAAVLLMPAAAGAQQNMKVGNLEINPFAGVQQSHDSNIYLTKSKVTSAFITKANLGLNLVESFGPRYGLTAGYLLETVNYTEDSGNNDAVHHNASMAFTGKLPKDMMLTEDDKYKQTTDQATSDLVARALRVENNMGFKLNAPLRGKFGFALAANHVYNNYLSSMYSALDREDFQAGFDLNYKLQPKTTMFAAYRYGILNYQDGYTNDATYNNMDLGVTGRLSNKLDGTVKAGMQTRNYDKDLANAKNNVTTMQYSVQTVWKPAGNTNVTLFAKRGNVETNYNDARFYTSTLTDLSVTRTDGKFVLGMGFSAENLAYSDKSNTLSAADKKRKDDMSTVRLKLDYNIQKWLTANIGYNYKHRASNFNAFEYDDNIINLGVQAKF